MRSLVIRHHATADVASSPIENGTGQRASKKKRRSMTGWWSRRAETSTPCGAALTARAAAVVYSMTWSARASSVGGIVRPRALAVFALMTSSNFVGCSIGSSAGLAPLKILSM
jgi:hypothetical protein